MGQHINLCPVKSVCKTAPSATNTASKSNPVVVDTIVSDGTNWAIKYSDGWIEQGGYVVVQSIAAYGTIEVTFNTAINDVDTSFTSVPVYVHCTPVYTGVTNSAFSDYGVESVSSTGFMYRKTNNNTYLSGFYWIAKGL